MGGGGREIGLKARARGQKMVPEGMSCRHTALRVRLFMASRWMLKRRMRRRRGCRRCWLSVGEGGGEGVGMRVRVEVKGKDLCLLRAPARTRL